MNLVVVMVVAVAVALGDRMVRGCRLVFLGQCFFRLG